MIYSEVFEETTLGAMGLHTTIIETVNKIKSS